MIYPWYNEERWIAERFNGDPAFARRIIRKYGPPPTETHFRHSYVSLRLRGLEYARLWLTGKFRYGIENSLLDADVVPPSILLKVLSEMFYRLAESNGDRSVIASWTDMISLPSLQRFIRHVTLNHLPEHWLESELLKIPTVLSSEFTSICSQVVVGEMGQKKSFKFIDLLALDPSNHLLWVIELKVPKATKAALQQMDYYLEWAESKLGELLDESRGYFVGVKEPQRYRLAAAFVAPDYTKNFNTSLDQGLLSFPVRVITLNADWRREIRFTISRNFDPGRAAEDFAGGEACSPRERRLRMNTTARIWPDCKLVDRLIEEAMHCGELIAKQVNVRSVDPPNRRFKYINLECTTGVFAQIHKDKECGGGCILVIGNADENCPDLVQLDEISDFDRLSGDGGPNKAWLRSKGKVFGHRKPARAFFVKDDLADASSNAGWQQVLTLLDYAFRRNC